MSRVLSVATVERAAVLRINRPEILNALNPPVVEALIAAVGAASADPGIDAIVLTGNGGAFSTGADLRAAAAMTDAEFGDYVSRLQVLADVVRHCPLPTIAAVHGHAVGGGLELAVNCDARIATPQATFRCPEVSWGLAMTNGSSQLMRELIGDGWTRELLLFGAVIDADTAARIGLVTRVVAPERLEATALAMAGAVSRAVQTSVSATKRLLNRSPRAWHDLLDDELAEIRLLLSSHELAERLAAYRR